MVFAACDRADVKECLDTYGDLVWSLARRLNSAHADAEDAVQDALLNAWNKRHQFDHTARLDTWIHRIAVNAALQLLRKQRPAALEIEIRKPRLDGDGPVELGENGVPIRIRRGFTRGPNRRGNGQLWITTIQGLALEG